jgi:hypothetical protein
LICIGLLMASALLILWLTIYLRGFLDLTTDRHHVHLLEQFCSATGVSPCSLPACHDAAAG